MSTPPAGGPPAWQTTADVLIPHPRAPLALVLGDEAEGWRLPFAPGAPPWQNRLPHMLAHLRASLGLELVVLRSAASEIDFEQRRAHMVYELDNRSPDVQCPPCARWVDRQGLSSLRLVVPEQAALLHSFLGVLERGERARRSSPWARPGWIDEACTWMADRLAALGTPLSGPVEQIKCWSISSVLRGQTSAGPVYFKVSAELPLFVDEPATMATLRRLFPAHIPEPLCVDSARRWMLLAAFERVVGDQGTLEDREAMLRIFGQLQRQSAASIPELLAAGCLDRRLDVLARQIEALAANRVALAGLDEAEQAQFQALVPDLARRCKDLAACGLPPTLVHGDLHLGNVALKEGRYQFFDWSDACVAHPLLDLGSVYFERDTALQERLRDAYLSVWAADLPRERLLEAWALARPLVSLHQAVSYQHINANLEDAALVDFPGEPAKYVRHVLGARS